MPSNKPVMRTARLRFALVVAALAVAHVSQAQTTQSPTVVVRGTIEAYDLETRVLTVSTAKKSERFVITEAARIRERWRAINASALGRLTGRRVAVRYVDTNDAKQVESVQVSGRNEEIR